MNNPVESKNVELSGSTKNCNSAECLGVGFRIRYDICERALAADESQLISKDPDGIKPIPTAKVNLIPPEPNAVPVDPRRSGYVTSL